MAFYSKQSLDILNTCHPKIIVIWKEVIKYFDNTIISGYRGYQEQTDYYNKGMSKVEYPYSKHNQYPSKAIDTAPYPIDWKDLKRFYYFGGFVKGLAIKHGVILRWGGDWDSDMQIKDNNFNDLGHFEILRFLD